MGVLELLFPGSDTANADKTRRNFERLNVVFGWLTRDDDSAGFSVLGIAVRFGTGSATWTASPGSANAVVTHGLGKQPVVAFTGTRDDLFGYAVTARSSTTVTVKGFTTHNAAVSTSRTFDWVAIG